MRHEVSRLPELWAKAFVGKLAAGLLWRPQRRLWAHKLPQAKAVLLVRVDNRVGEALLMTPLLEALAPHAKVDLLLHAKTARVLEGHPRVSRLFSLGEKQLRFFPLSKEVAKLRSLRWDVVVNCTNWSAPSTQASLLARWVAPHTPVVGPACAIAHSLADVAVPQREDTSSEVLQRLHLLRPLGFPLHDNYGMSFRKPRLCAAFEAWLATMASQPFAVVNPGSRLSSRRVPLEVFAALCTKLLSLGRTPLVVWGPGEENLAQQLVQAAPGSRLAPPTQLDELAALMQCAGFTVTNNTGPMHLSVAVGAPSLALFLNISMQRWGHLLHPHHCVDLTPLQHDTSAMAAFATQALVQFHESLPDNGQKPLPP